MKVSPYINLMSRAASQEVDMKFSAITGCGRGMTGFFKGNQQWRVFRAVRGYAMPCVMASLR